MLLIIFISYKFDYSIIILFNDNINYLSDNGTSVWEICLHEYTVQGYLFQIHSNISVIVFI